MQMEYEIRRHPRRRYIGLQILPDGRLVVRAPMRATKAQIEQIVCDNRRWIEEQRQKMRERPQNEPEALTEEQLQELARQAAVYIPRRAAYYAPLVGVQYGRITIRNQKTRWGSCSSKGNLNFNCQLMKLPPELIDYVVVHELCHRLEMNHSPRFWAEVERVLPDWRERRQKLRQYRV